MGIKVYRTFSHEREMQAEDFEIGHPLKKGMGVERIEHMDETGRAPHYY